MSVISKDLAQQISTKLTEKSRLAVDALRKDYQTIATEIYEDQVPEEIKKAFKLYPDWFYTRQSLYFNGHGFSFERVTPIRHVICNNGTEANLKLTIKTSDKLMAAKRKVEKAEKEYKLLKEESKQALLTLKTFTNIRKELPEAASMLPPPLSNALVVNFNSLKTRLNKQPNPTEIKQSSPSKSA
jgi:hypothetical protein